MNQYLLAIDQGTSSSRAILFERDGRPLATHQLAVALQYPAPGWVEQDPTELWQATKMACQSVMKTLGVRASEIAAIGISNQRETTIVWDKRTGEPVYPAIVWQDRRTAEYCESLSNDPRAKNIAEKTGLRLDPYFSGSKLAWILQNVPGARAKAERGVLLFGTVDTYLLWHLTGGSVHATDATNASRTLLFNIREQCWDQELLALFDIPASLLPLVKDSSADFGSTDPELFGGSIRIAGIAGDQQAATIGQACFQAGMMKATLGTGCFVVLNTGSEFYLSQNQLLTTIAYRLQGKVTYALEGSVFSAGTIMKWLRDNLHLIKKSEESAALAASIASTEGVYLVPAFTGLGAPYWDPHARAAITGITGNTQAAHIVRAGLEAVAYQLADLLQCMHADGVKAFAEIRLDGGMAENPWLMQFLADILKLRVERPISIETSALGAVFLAGLQIGMYQSLEEISELWQAKQCYLPERDVSALYAGWQQAVKTVLHS